MDEGYAPKHGDHGLCGTLHDYPPLCQIIIRHGNGPFERVLSDTAKRYIQVYMSDKTNLQIHQCLMYAQLSITHCNYVYSAVRRTNVGSAPPTNKRFRLLPLVVRVCEIPSRLGYLVPINFIKDTHKIIDACCSLGMLRAKDLLRVLGRVLG